MKHLLVVACLFGLFNVSALAVDLPAAFTKDARILFQGDSITHGGRGLSQTDHNHIIGHSYVFLIAGRFGADHPEQNLTFINRGVSGDTVPRLEKRWQTDTLDLKPDLLSILIGVNDNAVNVPFDQYEQTYDKLLTDSKAANPQLKLVLGEPFTLESRKPMDLAVWQKWKAGVDQRREIVAKLATKHGAALVKYQPMFDEACKRAPASHWIWDGVHPTYAGNQLMADEWLRTVREFWKN